MSDYPDYIVDEVHVVTALIGGVAKAGDEWILPEGKTLPSKAEIDAKREELKAEYDAQEYARNRAAEYPDMKDQLDYIFHNGVAKWKTDIVQPVKDKYPKPE